MPARPNRVVALRADCWRRVALIAALAALIAWLLLASSAHAAPRSISLAGVAPRLAAKARELERACGARVVSAVRRTHVAGTRRMSLHASGRAVDIAGPPRCLYARLRGWPGGVTVDYARVGHVHVSLGGREQGLRFAHRHGAAARRLRLARL